jgi:hypothetical protein
MDASDGMDVATDVAKDRAGREVVLRLLLGVRDARTRALCRAYEVVPPACGPGVRCGLDGGVVLD